MVFLIILSAMAAYPIQRNNTRFYKNLYLYFVMGLMFPTLLILLPLYRILSFIHLINTRLGIILCYIGGNIPFLVFYNVGFIQTIPKELDEAALIDGASKYQVFWKIIFPLLKNSLLTVIVIQMVWIWNDFLTPLVFLQSYDKMTVMVGMSNFIGERGADWPLIFAFMTISVLPVIVLYVIFQKYIENGLVAGAIKG
jgi:raffinose/stachyose/melibiose transport system permease protein